MSEIESLRQRVEAAASRFSEMDSLRQTQGERLLGLISELEQGLERKQEEIDRQQARFGEFEAEKTELEAQLATRQTEIEAHKAEVFRAKSCSRGATLAVNRSDTGGDHCRKRRSGDRPKHEGD